MFDLNKLLGTIGTAAGQGVHNMEHNIAHPDQLLSHLLGREVPHQLTPQAQSDGLVAPDPQHRFLPQWQNQQGWGAPDKMPLVGDNGFQKKVVGFGGNTGDQQVRSHTPWQPRYQPIPTNYIPYDDPRYEQI